jgi:hypothetical protein
LALRDGQFDFLLFRCFTLIRSLTVTFSPKNSRDASCNNQTGSCASVFREIVHADQIYAATQAEHFRALSRCQQREEAACARAFRLLRDLLTQANQKIADLERSIAEPRAQRYLDATPPLPRVATIA